MIGFLIRCLSFFFFIKVNYSAKLSLESVITKDVGQNDSAVLASLYPYTLYMINVSAFTSKGEGSHVSVEILTDEAGEYILVFIYNYLGCVDCRLCRL